MSRLWRYLIPCYVMLAVPALIAYIYATQRCYAHSWKWRQGVLTFLADPMFPMVGSPGGQGWSWIVGFKNELHRETAWLRVHEFTHVAQEFACTLVGLAAGVALYLTGHPILSALSIFIGGWLLFVALYGIGWVIGFIRVGRGTPEERERGWWFAAYLKIPAEVHANAVEEKYKARPSNVWGHQ